MTTPFDDAFFADEPVQALRRRVAPGPVEPGARRLRPIRIALLAVILVTTVGAGVIDHAVHRPSPPTTAPPPVSTLASDAVESSSWYCAGSAPNSSATTTLDLVNTTAHVVSGTLTAYNATTGQVKVEAIAVPAGEQSTEQPGSLVGGNPVAATVDLNGGGVLVTETIAGSAGWTEAACSRSTADQWYFASGITEQGDTLTMALFNPTATDAVVDMSFVTPSGLSQPEPFEGIVVRPGSLVVEEIDSYVQDASSVSTVVTVRTGSVVAAELQDASADGSHGLSLRLGVPALASSWSLPDSVDAAGGTSSLTVFNPTGRIDRVRLTVRPGQSPAAHFTQVIGPMSAWVFDTGAQARIPAGVPFVAALRTLSGPGVVVDRTVSAPRSLESPQFGAFTALGADGAAQRVAVLPAPGTEAAPSVPNSLVVALSVVNAGAVALSATVYELEGVRGLVPLTRVSVPAGGDVTVPRAIIGSVRRVPLVVSADGPVRVLEDLAPSAGLDVVVLAAAGSPSA
jgi:hypothetical protein